MKRLVAGVVATAALIGGLAIYDASRGKGGKLSQKMVFDPGVYNVTGDENGRVCLAVKYKGDAPESQPLAYRFLYKYDFRKLTPKQKEQAIADGFEATMEGSGFACKDPGGDWFFRDAYAQPHCESPECSGGCGTLACPATVVTGGGCVLGGINCVIVFICCGGPCTCG